MAERKTTTRPRAKTEGEKLTLTSGTTNLDDSQQAFCTETNRAVRLLAPAGSGKTYSLLWRCLAIAQAAAKNDSAARFLVFTFTRGARDELRDRLKSNSTFQPLRGSLDVTTLNSWGYRWLKSRMHHPRLITGTKERTWCMTNSLQPIWKKHPKIEEVLTDSKLKYRAPKPLMDLMDALKGMGFRHDTHDNLKAFSNHTAWLIENGMRAQADSMFRQLADLGIIERNATWTVTIKQAFENYFKFWRDSCLYLYETATLTLEDQKYWSFIELEKALGDRKFTTGVARYHHIFVDEFQDVNTLDLNLLKAIADINKSELCIVGDDDQAIYEWRGATPEFILGPEKYLGWDYKTFILETNYRSPKNIVHHSQKLIQHNLRRVPKNVRAASSEDAEINVFRTPSLEASVDYVLQTVRDLLANKTIKNIAIISRKRSQIIPYQIVFAGADLPFYAAEDLHVLLSDTFDELKRLLMLKAQSGQPKPFGPDPVEALLKLCDKVKRYPLRREDQGKLKTHILAERPKTLIQALESLYSYTGPLKGENTGGAMSKEFYEAISDFLKADTVADAIRALSLSFDGLQKDYGKSQDDIFYADPPFLYLSGYAERYGNDYVAFYEDVEKAITTLAKIPPADDDESPQDDSWKLPLHLMTALRAKGKEFDVVIILDCNQDIWPSKLAQTPAEVEAERRLFYVASTRAKKALTLLTNQRMFGEPAFPSPFITEMGLDNKIVDVPMTS